MLFPLKKKSIDPKSIYHAVSKYSEMSLDTQDVEDKQYFKHNFGLEFVNATSNQSIQYGNWVKHPEVIVEAAELVNSKRNITGVPSFNSVEEIDDYIDDVQLYCTAISGRNQLKDLKNCTLAQIRPIYALDEEKSYAYAKSIIEHFKEVGVDKENVIIKVPVTWESMQAVKRLTTEDGIQCLGTVVHSVEQAIMCAEAGCVLVSPYVDPLSQVVDPSTLEQQPADENYGVQLVIDIQKYYRAHGVTTKVCAAAFESQNTVLQISGVDGYTLGSPIINKLLHSEVPAGFKVPVIKSSYTVEEAGPKQTFINDRDAFRSAFESNEIAVARYTGAVKFFSESDLKSKPLIITTLQDVGLWPLDN